MSTKRRRAEEPVAATVDEDASEEEDEGEEEEEEGEEESSGDESSVSLQVDEDGRVCSRSGVLTSSMSFEPPVRVFDRFVPEDCVATLRTCCEQCFKAKPSKGRYSSGKTFWAERGQTPRCELEALALAILQKHCPEPAATAGVEWWTLCLDIASDVGFHWDRDYVLEDSGVNIHPMLSTVTYLSEPSTVPHVSTMTLDVTSPPSRDGELNPVALPKSGGMASCIVVPPNSGRHLVFDGRYLHGAPKRSSDVEPSGRRVTFLANIWVGHKPANASALPAQLQTWTVTGERLSHWSKLESIVSKKARIVEAVKTTTDASQLSSFPLEGGTLKVALPSSPSDGNPFAVQLAHIAANWSPTQVKRKKKRAKQ